MLLAADLLSANLGLVFWQTIVLLALLLLLRRYAWGPITSALIEREETIASSLNRAEAALEESKRLQERNAQARRENEQQAQRLLREAREEAQQSRDREVQRTREEISALRTQAQEDIARDKEKALQDLRSEVADLAILAAEKVLQENLDASRQRVLVDRFIDELSVQKHNQPPYQA
ncbi:MAG: F0F1 ATP synthase subunit B [Bacteroidetes bacterium]|nr:F0F1 ATP synthase subunit B [Bacteroidota bacterium]